MQHGSCLNEEYMTLRFKTLIRAAPLAFGFILMMLALYQVLRIRRLSTTHRGFGLLTFVIQGQGLYYILYVIIQKGIACINVFYELGSYCARPLR